MANITTSSDFLSTVASRQKPITCSWAITSIEENSPWKLSVCSLPTKSNILKTSSFFVEITSVQVSIGSTAFMTNVRFSRPVVYNFFSSCGFPFLSSQASAGTTSNCGRLLPTALTVCRLQPSLTKKFSRCMEGSVQIYSRWSKYAESCGQQMFLIQVCPSLHRSH